MNRGREIGLRLAVALLLLGASACSAEPPGAPKAAANLPGPAEGEEVAIFAGGCFWCMEAPFDELPGVRDTTVGYTGGTVAHPTYEQVSEGTTGHVEAVRVIYDPKVTPYTRLLEVFWRNVDPLDGGGQFCDRGSQYASAIFVQNEEQRRLAVASKRTLEKSPRFRGPIATEIREAQPFYAAESYHQDYYRKNPVRYRFYRSGCGRDARLAELWGDAAGH